jgi:hypothetical protein
MLCPAFRRAAQHRGQVGLGQSTRAARRMARYIAGLIQDREEDVRQRRYGFSFSWRRAVGISAAKGRLSRAIVVPLTQGGRERKLGRMVSSWLGAGLVIAILAILSKP